jgi:hypothetical protein
MSVVTTNNLTGLYENAPSLSAQEEENGVTFVILEVAISTGGTAGRSLAPSETEVLEGLLIKGLVEKLRAYDLAARDFLLELAGAEIQPELLTNPESDPDNPAVISLSGEDKKSLTYFSEQPLEFRRARVVFRVGSRWLADRTAGLRYRDRLVSLSQSAAQTDFHPEPARQ